MQNSKELSELFSKLHGKSLRLLESGANNIEVSAKINFRRRKGKFDIWSAVFESEFEILREDSNLEDSKMDEFMQ